METTTHPTSGRPDRRRRPRLRLAVLAGSVALLAAACFSGPPAPPPAPPPPPAPANLTLTGPSATLVDAFPDSSSVPSATYTVANTGGVPSGPLTITLDQATGSGAWTVNGGTCGLTGSGNPAVAAGGSCTIDVTYEATGPSNAGDIHLSVSASPGGIAAKVLFGATTTDSHLAFGVPSLNIDDDSNVGASTLDVQLTNTSVVTTTVDISIVGASGTGTFSQNAGTCPAGLAPGASCTVHVFYQNDSGTGSGAATLQATGDDNVATVALTGAGTP